MSKQEIVAAGWVFGNFDGFVGERIQPHLRHIPEVTHTEIQELRASLAVLTDRAGENVWH